jgi:hypothetical protein
MLKLANAPKKMNKELDIIQLQYVQESNYNMSNHNASDGRPSTFVDKSESDTTTQNSIKLLKSGQLSVQ